jgi:hypothetical protein
VGGNETGWGARVVGVVGVAVAGSAVDGSRDEGTMVKDKGANVALVGGGLGVAMVGTTVAVGIVLVGAPSGGDAIGVVVVAAMGATIGTIGAALVSLKDAVLLLLPAALVPVVVVVVVVVTLPLLLLLLRLAGWDELPVWHCPLLAHSDATNKPAPTKNKTRTTPAQRRRLSMVG